MGIYSLIENPANYYNYVTERYQSVNSIVKNYITPNARITAPFGMNIKCPDGKERIFPEAYDPQNVFGFTLGDLVNNGGIIHDILK